MSFFIITEEQKTKTDKVLEKNFSLAHDYQHLIHVFREWLFDKIQTYSFEPFLSDDEYGSQTETWWFMEHDPQNKDIVSQAWMEAAGGSAPHELYRRIIKELWPIYATSKEVIETKTVWTVIDNGSNNS